MTKTQRLAFGGAFLITALFAVFWHVVLFEQQFLSLGVFTRMDEPLYFYGVTAWALEAIALVLIYFRTDWRNGSILDALKVAWLMGLFASASAMFGMAAKVRIDDLVLWFLLTGGFIALHTTLLGLWLGLVSWKSKPV
ncbi:hypothetical protein [uncultured Litoreibacter sp.]|uniref:hypothetical protein n=1 Tax=uncultured Litoreibacter sp. TaxID=1392394 RepID=UPI002626DB65|nr:hypothetical protein [uncultured Litoreibacter sp.]